MPKKRSWQLKSWQKFLSPARFLMIGFAVLAIVGAILLSLPVATENGEGLPFVDALFMATSAICVTGLVVVDTGSTLSMFGEVVLLTLVQIGGLGIMTVATFVTIWTGKKIGLTERLHLQQSLNVSSLEGLIRLSRNVVLMTLAIEFVFALILAYRFSGHMPLGKALYYGIFHSIAAFCNAGFDLFGDYKSLADYAGDPVVNISVMTLVSVGGLGMAVMADLLRKLVNRKERLMFHSKLVLIASVVLFVVGTLGYYALEHGNQGTLAEKSEGEQLLAAGFASVTARSSGFATINYEEMSQSGQFWTMMLMFIGASPGSAGGGIRTTTALVILLFVWTVVTNRGQTVIFKRAISPRVINKSLTIAVMSMTLIVVTTMILTITENREFNRVLFEAVSAVSTVGLSTNLTPELSPAGKVVVLIVMYIGRLGPLTLALALAARHQGKPSNVRYPEGNVYVG
ncbi:Trk family potassium uptake protein [Tumebacillus algifaecis]|uniref:Trk family potassium uptake protein n=1 Tax=Tumebacillus algifaecis TaxID=1214604 RepID=A0A223CZY5_9BACL|nr:TrkH family potassium uptake protein [Tumebacillus algifaecis]ASS75059.1 Trk family potassium uptake protein [Tumebacillus algifaecis]